ncbi:dihydrolipoamide acetyltransferase family protein [Niallia sp. NCCP-28]|uniref:dihydrolipoamide acetyltransferase family protein n=1 Tax=Niallia sp. NCCP-28 TaxID=2934712 RepID=UPI0020844C51|nr:dihydrolipoamide acetyltransferase family protein [Niallia sp. NCCP-28]GKU81118.1 dihydrolipoamide acetyltransferase component of pyruvate dehydrogenase complex [Niallia sp. NCCP-28]
MTREKITMPKLGESVTEGTLQKWLVAVGDTVKKYEPLAEVLTDKVSAEIPSSFAGVISELLVKEDETVQVGEVICTMEVEDGKGNDARLEQAKEEKKKEPAKSVGENKQRYSPAVLKLSQEAGLDLNIINGTGAGGRITRKDVLRAIKEGTPAVFQTEPQAETIANEKRADMQAPAAASNKQEPKQIPTSNGDIEIPITPVRKAIAANMQKSKHEIPHAWTMIEVDVTSLVNYRNKIKDSFKTAEGFNLTFFAFFVKAVARGLKEFPELNSTWAGDKIVRKKDINISIAVAAEDSLFVPVIRHADEKSIKGIAREITELAKKARTGKLTVEDMQGGTFTVNNTGSFGSIQSMGIINHPQSAILQVESIVKRPIIKNGMIAISDMVNLCLSLDHRVLDGLVCGRFLQRVKDILENTNEDSTTIY